jgi:hypothetical protein
VARQLNERPREILQFETAGDLTLCAGFTRRSAQLRIQTPMNDDGATKGVTLPAEGLSPLPTQLNRTESRPELRAVLWQFIHDDISR